MTAETGQLPPNRFVYVREETWLATEARLAAAERVVEAARKAVALYDPRYSPTGYAELRTALDGCEKAYSSDASSGLQNPDDTSGLHDWNYQWNREHADDHIRGIEPTDLNSAKQEGK